jgi:hypothetical protein
MRSRDRSAPTTTNQRIQEVATILARGLLRLHTRAALAAASDPQFAAKNPRKSAQDCLEVPRTTVLSGHPG